jgi:hypothetical protein
LILLKFFADPWPIAHGTKKENNLGFWFYPQIYPQIVCPNAGGRLACFDP